MNEQLTSWTSLALTAGALVFFPLNAKAECPELLDGDGAVANEAVYHECNDGNGPWQFFPLTNGTWTNVTVDWGDGSAAEVISEWSDVAPISHMYPYQDHTSYTLTFVSSTCSATATLHKSVLVNPAIVVPEGWPTGACAPATLNFMNGSTNDTPDTEFSWSFDDGSTYNYGAENDGATVSHLYNAFTTGCQREVTLTATNACRTSEFGVPAAVTIDYINIWDRDNPMIAASDVVLCWPENTVDLRNTSEKVCLANGNTQQRLERWDFGGPYGPGGLESIDWRPWTTSTPITLTFPSTGIYTVELEVENYCGVDNTTLQIEVREPLTAELTGPSEACQGERLDFMASSPGADWFNWDFYGTNAIWYPSSTGEMQWTYNSPGQYTITVAMGLAGETESCVAQAIHKIDVLPKPRAEVDLSQDEGCDAMTVVAEEIYLEGTAYEWALPDGSIAFGPESPALELLTSGTHVFGVTVTGSNGCTRQALATAEVFASPAADFASGDVCEGDLSAFVDLSLPQGASSLQTWQWTFGDGSVSEDQHPEHLFENAGTFDVELEVSDLNCTSRAVQEVEVLNAPELLISSNISEGCTPLFVDFVASSDGTVAWTFGDDHGADGDSVSHVFLGDPSVAQTYEVTALAINEANCATVQTMEVSRRESAEALGSVSGPECSPFSPVFVNESVRADSYKWTFPDNSVSTDVTPEYEFTNTTGYEVAEGVELVALHAGGCHDTITVPVRVYPEALFSMNLASTEECAPFSIMAPPVPNAENHIWDFGDGTPTSAVPNPIHVYDNNTDAPVTYTLALQASNAFGCPGTVARDIVVNPTPLADFSADVQNGCAPLTVTFTETSQHAQQHMWDYGDASQSTGWSNQSHEHTFELGGFQLAARSVTLTVEAEGGCTASHTVAVEVYPQVHAMPIGELESCAPWAADLVALGYEMASDHSVTWTIDNDETFSGTNLQRTFPGLEGEDQLLDLNLHVESPYGCAAEANVTAVVHHQPVAQFNLSDAAACAGTSIGYEDASEYASNVTLDWGDESPETSSPMGSHVYDNDAFEPRVLEVVQTATTDHGCSAVSSVNHTVYPQVRAQFLQPAPACAPAALTLVNQSTNANGTFTWDFGDGAPVSHSAQPSHLFDTPADMSSTYNVSLLATSTYGCMDSTSHAVVIEATPVADLDIVAQGGCYPLEVTFANQSVGGDHYDWAYGTGMVSSETAMEHTISYFNPTGSVVTYPAVLTVHSDAGCSSQDVVYIEVLPEVEARIEGGLSGCTPLDVDFLNLSDGAVTYEWNFGDGGQSATMHTSHTFTALPGEDAQYTVTLTATSVHGCTDTAEVSVQVFAQPDASFVSSGTQLTYPDAEVVFSNTSTAGESAAYYWTFGDGQVSYAQNPGTHTFNSWGTYDITLEVDNGMCADVATSAVQILAPVPTIGFTGEGTGCAPLTVAFQNESSYASSYRWEFSDGSVRSDDHPVHVFHEPGVYDVTLFVEGYEGSELVEVHSAVVEVFPTAEAAFTLNPNQVMVAGQPVFCLNLSENATGYAWDFGDGQTSIAESPVHEYLEPGIFDVSLTATNVWGCESTYILPEAVLAEAGGAVEFPTAFTPNATGSNGGYYDPTGYDNDVFRPMHVGVESYELMVFTKWGEMVFFSNDVHVGWDGYIQGQLASQDVYAWKCTAVLSDGAKVQQIGNVTLLAR